MQNLKNKYYTPTIDEFCIGFEYEFKTSKDWEKKIVSWYDFSSYSEDYIKKEIEYNRVRVKYLDKEDIENLKYKFEDYNSLNLTNSALSNDNKIKIRVFWNADLKFRENLIRITKNDGQIFLGNIKNKLELVKLLKQLNVETN